MVTKKKRNLKQIFMQIMFRIYVDNYNKKLLFRGLQINIIKLKFYFNKTN